MKSPLKNQLGLSIVELMVAITLAAIITAAVLAMFINANRSYNEDERYARMMENGRFAINTLATDLMMVDFWGEMVTPGSISIASLTAGADCDTQMFNPVEALLYYRADATTPVFNPDSCAWLSRRAGTDVLAIKRVAGSKVDPDNDNSPVFLRTNMTEGALRPDTHGDDNTFDTDRMFFTDTGYHYWPYMQRLYYIRDNDEGVPFLCRTEIDPAAPNQLREINSTDDCLAEGIEFLYVEFGLDTNGDGIANRYVADVTAAEMNDAVSARVYLLARSTRTSLGYTNDKTFALGAFTLGPFNDGFYRRVFSTTVMLRNPKSLILIGTN